MEGFRKVVIKEGTEVYKKTRQRVPAIRKSLVFLLQSLQGTEVVVELKQDIQIRGVVDEVDVAMNLALHSATQTNRDGSTVEFESIVVQGPSIRLVQIPSKIRMRAQVSEYLKKIDRIKVQSRPHAIKDRPKLVAPEPSDRSDIVLN